MPKEYDEAALEDVLEQRMTRFLLELGDGWAFVGRQKEIIISGKTRKIDLPFYHIYLRCYVVLELKVKPFDPEFTGKLNFYVNAVNEFVKRDSDNPTIGLLICRDMDRTEVQLSFQGITTPTITAILHENRPTKGYDILRGMEKGTPVGLDDKGRPYLHCRVTLRNPDYTSVLQLRQIEEDHKLHIDDINSEFMISVFAIKGMGEAYIQFFMMTGIALLIVVATSVVLIYNAFGMSLAEKIRYLGMLASVGATKSQKRASIYYEGLVLGIVGIPLGILTGILGAAVTLNVLGSRLLETEVIVGAEGMRGGIPIVVSPLVILAIVILSSITIFISALIPAIKASNVMPVDAMRQTNIVKVRAGKLKTNPFIKNIFGYEGVLACKNIKRNGVKGTVIVISLAISVKQLCNLMCQPD